MLTGLIPLHFDDCLPFSMFTIADINKINSADFNQTLEKFDQKCFAETHIWLAYPRNTTLNNPNHTLLSISVWRDFLHWDLSIVYPFSQSLRRYEKTFG